MRFYLKNSRPDVSDRTLKSFREPDASGHVWEAPVRATEDYFYCDRDVLAGAEKIDAPCFLGSPDEDLNWGMWLLFNIPSAHQYRSLAEKYPKFLCFAELGWQRAFLEALGIGPDRLVPQKRGQVYYASSAISLRTTFRGMVLRPTDIEAFDSYADLFASQLTPEATPQRIYISRSNQKTRQLTNEAELEGQL
jgi:capsular polysaccharide biosynthesis protein